MFLIGEKINRTSCFENLYSCCRQCLRQFLLLTSGYATMVHGGDAIRITLRQLSQTWKLRHYDVINDVITRKL